LSIQKSAIATDKTGFGVEKNVNAVELNAFAESNQLLWTTDLNRRDSVLFFIYLNYQMKIKINERTKKCFYSRRETYILCRR